MDKVISAIKRTEENDLLRTYLRTLEILIQSNFNLQQALNLGIIVILMGLLIDEKQEPSVKKISIRCLAFASRDEGTVNFLRSE